MTNLKIIWLDVIYQLRLAIAEKLIDIILFIMPSGQERKEFTILAIQYYVFSKSILETENRIKVKG